MAPVSPVVVTYNAPAKEYIGHRADAPDVQDTVSDADVDAKAQQDQRAAFDEAEDAAEKRWNDEYHPTPPGESEPPHYVRRQFGPFTAPSHQSVRERIAKELLEAKLTPAHSGRRTKPE